MRSVAPKNTSVGSDGRVTARPKRPIRVSRTTVPWPAFDPVTVEWNHGIPPTVGPWVTLPGLEQAGGNLFVAGTVNDNRKPPTTSGRPRDSGLAASYSSSGDLRWLTVVSLTQHTEGFYGIAVGHGAEYAADNNGFGYGLISKLDLSGGQVLANLTLGDDHYLSGFYSAIWTANGLLCGGLTKLEYTNGLPIIPEAPLGKSAESTRRRDRYGAVIGE